MLTVKFVLNKILQLMNEKHIFKGLWFLPNTPNDKIAGILTFIPNEKIELELIGDIENNQDNIFKSFINGKVINIIHGISSDAKKLTLVDCLLLDGEMHFDVNLPFQIYSARIIIEGMHLQSSNDTLFNNSEIHIPLLSKWCYPALIQETINENYYGIDLSNKFQINDTTINEVKVNNNTSLRFVRHSYTKGNYKEDLKVDVYQETFLKFIKKEKTNLHEFINDVKLFEDFLSFAMLSSSKATRVKLYNDEGNKTNLGYGRSSSNKVNVYYIQEKHTTEFKSANVLFKYNHVDTSIENILEKWYKESDNLIPIKKHLIESVKPKTIFTSLDFLIVIQAIEGYGCRFLEIEPLFEILEDILKEFKDVSIIRQLNIEKKEVVDSRHYYSHFFKKDKKENVLELSKLPEVTHKLRIMLICCLLDFIGLNNEEINAIFRDSSSKFIRL